MSVRHFVEFQRFTTDASLALLLNVFFAACDIHINGDTDNYTILYYNIE